VIGGRVGTLVGLGFFVGLGIEVGALVGVFVGVFFVVGVGVLRAKPVLVGVGSSKSIIFVGEIVVGKTSDGVIWSTAGRSKELLRLSFVVGDRHACPVQSGFDIRLKVGNLILAKISFMPEKLE